MFQHIKVILQINIIIVYQTHPLLRRLYKPYNPDKPDFLDAFFDAFDFFNTFFNFFDETIIFVLR